MMNRVEMNEEMMAQVNGGALDTTLYDFNTDEFPSYEIEFLEDC